MAHYAYLDENNVVVMVTVGQDENETIDGLDTETYYALGTPYTVKRTSYSGSIRYNYAGKGYSYDLDTLQKLGLNLLKYLALILKYGVLRKLRPCLLAWRRNFTKR
jgi:hypothetical protein